MCLYPIRDCRPFSMGDTTLGKEGSVEFLEALRGSTRFLRLPGTPSLLLCFPINRVVQQSGYGNVPVYFDESPMVLLLERCDRITEPARSVVFS